jgi:hypothetical protein
MTLALVALEKSDLCARMDSHGYVVTSGQTLSELVGVGLADLQGLSGYWDDLALDQYLKDGGRYRQRRHSSLEVTSNAVTLCPHRAHWQPLEYNALHGGMLRWFDPIRPAMLDTPAWQALLKGLGQVCTALRPEVQRWFVEAHPFRIDTTGGIGRPTPEGAHRDGVDFVVVILVGRHGIKGAETRVFAAGEGDGLHQDLPGQRFTLHEPWSMLLLDDARVIHESTPIQPLQEHGHRDTLVLTWRAGGFQGPA